MAPMLRRVLVVGFGLFLGGCASAPRPPGEIPSAAQFSVECRDALARARTDFDKLEQLKPPFTRGDVLDGLNALELQLADLGQRSNLVESVHPDPAVRESAASCSRDVAQLGVALSLSRPVYDAVSAVDMAGAANDMVRYRDKTLLDYRLAGIDQNDAVRNTVRELRRSIEALQQEFERNIREDQRSVVLSGPNALEGLPADYVSSHAPDAQGHIAISTDYPDYLPFMRYSHSDVDRRALYLAFNNRGFPANQRVLGQLLEKRMALARLLGFSDYAAFSTSDMMAGSPARVQAFIDQVDAQARPVAAAEQRLLLQRLRREDAHAQRVQPWQQSYMLELLKREQFSVDSREVRAFFPYATTRGGVFTLVQQMFGVSIRPWHTITWHPSVEAYEIVQGDQVIGRFFLDMHPRQGKYAHAAQFPMVTGIAGRQLPVAALVCNFPGEGQSDALLEHADVETFLHEFGHLLHHIFAGEQRYAALSGVATEGDFIEAPSQMLEEWVWHPDTLALMSKNASGARISPALVERMAAARMFGLGLQTRQQLFYASLSLQLHQRDVSAAQIDGFAESLQARYSPFPPVAGTHFYASFDHLGGYASNYYTYMWSDVISSDLFSRFEREGMLNPVTTAAYRNSVLSAGGSRPAADLVSEFLGRPYDARAFSRKLQRAASVVQQVSAQK